MAVALTKPAWEQVGDEDLLTYARMVNPANLRRLVEVEALRWKVFPALSHGFVTLVDVMGDDQSVVQAARTSYGEGTRHVSEDDALISYLMRHRHTTPYEMAEIKLFIKCPMDMWRQQIRHRTASVNEYSTRYSKAIDEADVTPDDGWRLQSQSNKQGSSGCVEEWPEGYRVFGVSPIEGHLEEPPDPPEPDNDLSKSWDWIVGRPMLDPAGAVLIDDQSPYGYPRFEMGYVHFDGCEKPTPGQYLSAVEDQLQQAARGVYEERVDLFGVAREQARKDLPLSTYTQAYWKIDLHNLFHFLGLRMEAHAQKEIREYSTIIGEEIVKPLFPKCWAAFEKYRLNATFVSAPMKQVITALVSLEDDDSMDCGSTAKPPYDQRYFERCVTRVFPEWMKRDGEGKLKPHREREEVRSALQGLGLLAVE